MSGKSGFCVCFCWKEADGLWPEGKIVLRAQRVNCSPELVLILSCEGCGNLVTWRVEGFM